MQLGTSGGQAQRAPPVSGVKHTNSGPWAPSAGTGWAQRGPEAAPPRPKDASLGSQLGYLFSPALDAELQALPGLGGVRPGGGLCPPGSMPGPLRLMRVGAQERDFGVTPEPCTGSSRAEMCRGGGIAVRARPGPPRDPATQGGLKDTVTGMGCRATCSLVPPTHVDPALTGAHSHWWPRVAPARDGAQGTARQGGVCRTLDPSGPVFPSAGKGDVGGCRGGWETPPALSGGLWGAGGAGRGRGHPSLPSQTPAPRPRPGKTQALVWGRGGGRAADRGAPCSGHGPAHSSKGWTQEGPWAGPGEVDRGFQAPGAGTHLTPLVDAAGPGLRRAARPSPERAPAATLLGPGVRWALAARPAGGRPPHFLLACRLRAAWEQRVDCARSGPAPTRHSPAGPVGDVCVCSQARILWPACKGLRAAALSTSRRPGGSGPFPG